MTAGTSQNDQIPPQVLRDYALLADGERGAVLGPRGDIVWLCAPRWDSDAVFTSLIGGDGEYTITPASRNVWGGYYEDGSMIWRSRWVTNDGIVECREALTFPGDAHQAVLLRRIHAPEHDATVTVSLTPRAGYGEHPLSELHHHAGVWTARSGGLYLRWNGGQDAHPRHSRQSLHAALHLQAGQHHDLVLELSDQPLPDEAADADIAWRATEANWRAAVPNLDSGLNPPDTRRSYAVLRGLTSSGGGMVAAATTSLPERAEAGRNYDYRYVWIRDQCYAGQAVAAAGPHPLLDDAVSFVSDRLLEHGLYQQDQAVEARAWYEKPNTACGHHNCSARNTTPASTKCAATYPRRSSTPSPSKPPLDSPSDRRKKQPCNSSHHRTRSIPTDSWLATAPTSPTTMIAPIFSY